MKHRGVFANMKALLVLVACLPLQEELKKKKICSVDKPHCPQERGMEADEGLPTGQKIRDRMIRDQDEKLLPVRTDLPWESLAGVGSMVLSTG